MQSSNLREGAGAWASVKSLMMRYVQMRSLTYYLGLLFVSWWDRHRSGLVVASGVEDTWGNVILLISDAGVGWAGDWGRWGGGDREKRQGGVGLVGVACACGGIGGGVLRCVGFVGDGSL